MRCFGRAALAVLMVVSCNHPGDPAPLAPEAPERPVAPPKTLYELAAKCALISSCARPHDPPRVREPSVCVESWLQRGGDDCLLKANTCAAVDLCLHAGNDVLAASFCAAHPGALGACDDRNRFVSCGEDRVTPVDCGVLGATCGESRSAGGLIVRGCISRALCPAGAPDARCEGKGAVLSCNDGIVDRVTCPSGEQCEEHREADGEQTAMCEISGDDHCDDVGASACREEQLVECLPHGHFGAKRSTDCGKLGLVCRARGRQAACVVAKPTCASGPARCENGLLVFCAAGVEMKVSCAAVGLGRCDPDTHGPEAACVR